jgi:hypothetical protein
MIGPKGHDHEEQPLEFLERPDRSVERKPIVSQIPNRVRTPERDHHQQSVEDLLQLTIELLFADQALAIA